VTRLFPPVPPPPPPADASAAGIFGRRGEEGVGRRTRRRKKKKKKRRDRIDPAPSASRSKVGSGSGGATRTDLELSMSYRIYRPDCLNSTEKAPLLVLHGGPSLPSEYLYPLASRIPEGRSVVFYDQIGCGRSSIPLQYEL